MDASSSEMTLLEATQMASEMLNAPSPSLKKRGSTKRRKSVLLGLGDDDDDGGPSIAAALSARGGSQRRRSLYLDMDGGNNDKSGEPSPNLKRRGSIRKQNSPSNPYPTTSSRRGSMRRFAGNDGEDQDP